MGPTVGLEGWRPSPTSERVGAESLRVSTVFRTVAGANSRGIVRVLALTAGIGARFGRLVMNAEVTGEIR